METLSLLGSASTLASSVVELEVSTKVAEPGSSETPGPNLAARGEASTERSAPSEEGKEEDVGLYEEPEFRGIGNIDLEMEQIFADMELLQKKASEDLGSVGEENSFRRRDGDGDQAPLDVFEDAEVEASGLSLADLSSADGAEEVRTCNSESSEDDDLRREMRPPSPQNLEELAPLGEEDPAAQESEDPVPFANGKSTVRDVACGGKRSSPSGEDLHNSINDRELISSSGKDNCKVNGYPVGSETLVEEGFADTETVLSASPTDRSEMANTGKKDLVQMENDRLLIEKIKNYYETAEMNNDQFYLQRRESISFIPTGVVRDSVLRFNYNTQHESIQEAQNEKAGSSGSRWSVSAPGSTSSSDSHSGSRPGSSHEPEHPKASEEGPPPRDGAAESESEETEFKSCAEIIKVWREMEKAAHFCHKHDSWNGCARAAGNDGDLPGHRRASYSEPLLILEDSDLAAELPEDSPGTEQRPSDGEPDGKAVGKARRGEDYCAGQGAPCAHAPCCASHEAAGMPPCGDGCLFQNSDKIMNKVQVLAKLYSQRISRKKAPMPRRIWELGPEARAEPKQRKRRPVTKLSKAQEEEQEIQTC
ncbi:uncharacterized protein LOC144489941, partial [Mustelus asterias]